ncbi:CIA30 family protein [Alteromonas sp. ASW11-19]|uniref:CIA30 family protein n=1 Tax=Alteromonas salexigens TaxID=2982530 RepID=A0ABT2VSL7_9ALTE|nr:CIA30 family protein [Alteromonas salexigens]MCU7555917.1 CIA30 family protein [Alteromonas salexigens]
MTTEPNTSTHNLAFTQHSERDQWRIVNDTVMGGRSVANLQFSEKGMVFSGRLSLENNGGFASVRRSDADLSWQRDKAVQVTATGDGRTYQFRVYTKLTRDGVAYAANLPTQTGARVQITFSEADFSPVWRGRPVPDAPPLHFDDVRQLGFMLVDKQAGDFQLTVESVGQ